MRKHEVVADASVNRRCVDGHGCWWTAPHAVALDLASLGTWHGLRYRLGLHHVGAEARLVSIAAGGGPQYPSHPGGPCPRTLLLRTRGPVQPQPLGFAPSQGRLLEHRMCWVLFLGPSAPVVQDVEAKGAAPGGGEAHLPQGALPGTRVQAGSSLEGEVVIWKDRCERKRRAAESARQQALQMQERRSLQDRCYNLLASRPRITLSGLLGTPRWPRALHRNAGPRMSRCTPSPGGGGEPDCRTCLATPCSPSRMRPVGMHHWREGLSLD